MLETLDTVPWDTLEHAYGKASEIPGLIRDLASSSKKVRRAAYSRFGCTIYHQGTVYSSTAYIVPFFCELLEAQGVKDKTWLLHFLATIADGSSYLDVHVREQERSSPEFQRELAKELNWVQAAGDAVSDGYLTYIHLLEEKKTRRRAYAAYTLVCCSSHAQLVIPAMQEHLAREEKQQVRASIMLSLGQLMLWNEQTQVFFTQLLQGKTKPLLKIAAAMAYASSAQEAAPLEVVQVLLEGYKLPQSIKNKFARLPFARVNMDASMSSALRSIGLTIAPLVVPTLTHALAHSNAWSGLTLVDNLLYFALEGGIITNEMTVNDLTDMQRKVLRTLVQSKEIWMLGNMQFTIGRFFTPLHGGSTSIWSRENVIKFLDKKK